MTESSYIVKETLIYLGLYTSKIILSPFHLSENLLGKYINYTPCNVIIVNITETDPQVWMQVKYHYILLDMCNWQWSFKRKKIKKQKVTLYPLCRNKEMHAGTNQNSENG